MDAGMLLTAQVGYVVTGMRSVIQTLPGFKAAKHMVLAGVYPADGSDFDDCNDKLMWWKLIAKSLRKSAQ